MLNKDGGYVSCTYFTLEELVPSPVGPSKVIKTGTDGGGAIEIYSTLQEAQARCDYLAQFDGTLLYSGSFALIGTNIIRTSYQLTTDQQIDLTNKIVMSFTALQ